MTRITRVEVIDENGRSYVNWEEDNDITLSYQDDGRTLKVFVNTMKPKSPVEEAYKDWWGEYPETGNWDSFDDKRWQGFQAGYHLAYEEKVSQEPEEEPEELKTLYQMLYDDELPVAQCKIICEFVKKWMSQYADNVLRGECKKGYEYCLLVLEENLK